MVSGVSELGDDDGAKLFHVRHSYSVEGLDSLRARSVHLTAFATALFDCTFYHSSSSRWTPRHLCADEGCIVMPSYLKSGLKSHVVLPGSCKVRGSSS